MVLFLLSVVLLCLVSALISQRFAVSSADRFWLFFASIALQLGGIATITSALQQLNRFGWIAVQLGLLILAAAHQRWRPAKLPGLMRACLHGIAASYRSAIRFASELSALSVAAIACTAAIIVISCILQLRTPIYLGDEKMYHASRVIYWIQHGNVFPYTSHNDRQNVFTFGSELFFLWPVLLTRSETAGRIVFWMGFPFAAIGQYCLLRCLRASRLMSLVGVLILVSTPIVFTYSVGLKPETWAMCALTGVGFWAVRLCSEPAGAIKNAFLMGVMAVLTLNIRMTALAILPVCLALPFLVQAVPSRGHRIRALSVGILTGLLFSGILIPLGFNLVRYGNVLGPRSLQRVVGSDITLTQLQTHSVRLPLLLFELPEIPAQAARTWLADTGNKISSSIGASRVLPGERTPWPGVFSFVVPEYATRFSLGGMLWLPTLGIALFGSVREVVRTWPKLNLAGTAAITLLSVVLLVSILYGVRWMSSSALPERFLITPYALGVAISTLVLGTWMSGKPWKEAFALALIVCTVYPALRMHWGRTMESIAAPVDNIQIDAPFSEALASISSGSRILFAGDQGAPDYPLFAPRRGYDSAVIPWGKTPFDEHRMRTMIDAERITHVLIEDDQMLHYHWDPPISTKEMVEWLSRQPDMHQFKMRGPIRLFETSRAVPTNPNPFLGILVVPANRPIISVQGLLKDTIGLDAAGLRTPWAIEELNHSGLGFLWIGQGESEGLGFALWSRTPIDVQIQFDVHPGPSRTQPERTVTLRGVDSGTLEKHTFAAEASVAFPIRLNAGQNRFTFYALDAPNKVFEHDKRNIIVGVSHVSVNSREPVTR